METALSHSLPTTLGGARSRLATVEEKLMRTQARLKRFATENEGRIEGVMRGIETIGGGAAVGYLAGRYGTGGAVLQIAGFDADLVIGGLMFAGGLFEVGGKYNAHLYDIGAGALAFYAGRETFTMGAKAAVATPATTTTTATTATTTAGVAPPSAWVPRR
jgi:hypothetical protein